MKPLVAVLVFVVLLAVIHLVESRYYFEMGLNAGRSIGSHVIMAELIALESGSSEQGRSDIRGKLAAMIERFDVDDVDLPGAGLALQVHSQMVRDSVETARKVKAQWIEGRVNREKVGSTEAAGMDHPSPSPQPPSK